MSKLAALQRQHGLPVKDVKSSRFGHTLADRLHDWKTAPSGFQLLHYFRSHGIRDDEFSAAEDFINKRKAA